MTIEDIQKRYHISDVLAAGINTELNIDDIIRNPRRQTIEHLNSWMHSRYVLWGSMDLTEKVTTESVEKHLWLGRIMSDSESYYSSEFERCHEQKQKLNAFITEQRLNSVMIANITYAVECFPAQPDDNEVSSIELLETRQQTIGVITTPSASQISAAA